MAVYILWFVVALGLLVAELHSVSFFAIFLAAGAFVAGVIAFVLPDSAFWIQAVIALLVAVVGVILIRPILSARIVRRGPGTITPGVHGGFVGQRALATDPIGDELHPGHVRLAGEMWLAYTDTPQSLDANTPVVVTAVHGTTLVVRSAG